MQRRRVRLAAAQHAFSSGGPRTGDSALKPDIAAPGVSIVESFDLVTEVGKGVDGTAKFDAWSSSISTGGFATVSPGGSDASNAIAVDSAEWALTPALGLMVVTLDNANGESQAQLIPVKLKK